MTFSGFMLEAGDTELFFAHCFYWLQSHKLHQYFVKLTLLIG